MEVKCINVRKKRRGGRIFIEAQPSCYLQVYNECSKRLDETIEKKSVEPLIRG